MSETVLAWNFELSWLVLVQRTLLTERLLLARPTRKTGFAEIVSFCHAMPHDHAGDHASQTGFKMVSRHRWLVTCQQPRSQALPSPERKTLLGSGHVAPRFWVVTNKINVADVLKIDSCSYLALCRVEKIMFSSKQTHKFDYFICYHLKSGWHVTRPNQGLSLGRGKSLGTSLTCQQFSTVTPNAQMQIKMKPV